MLITNEDKLGRTKLRKVSAYVTHEMYAELESLAKKEMRTVSSMGAVAIAQLIERAKAEGKL